MSNRFHELRERLLQAGIAPRHVRRYVKELDDHLADLRAEEELAGRNEVDAESAAIQRLGGVDQLVKAVTERPQLRSWCARAPWAVLGLGPLLVLAATYFTSLLLLWSGWQIFLPGSETPFGGHRLSWLANLFFQFDRALYFGAPILIGWGIALLAARQRLKALWPATGVLLLSWAGSAAQVSANRTTVPGGMGHISMNFIAPASIQGLYDGMLHASVIAALSILPYLIWRAQRARSLSV